MWREALASLERGDPKGSRYNVVVVMRIDWFHNNDTKRRAQNETGPKAGNDRKEVVRSEGILSLCAWVKQGILHTAGDLGTEFPVSIGNV